MRNIGKRLLCMLFVAVMLMSMIVLPEKPVQAATDGLDLSKMQIVKPASPTAVENTAATELRDYIKKITGTTLAIMTEGRNSGAGIYIGATKYATNNGVTYPTANDPNGEAWAIKAVGNNLVLTGAKTRGALYAVYHLLEDVLGVHWWNPWEEDVPTGNAIVPKDYAASGVPALEYREIFIGARLADDMPFYARNRMNGSVIYRPEGYGGVEYYGAPSHTHTFDRYFPAQAPANPDAWQKAINITSGDLSTNPEWYALGSDGNRSAAQLCLTNSGLRAEFASRFVKSIAYCYNQFNGTNAAKPSYFAIVPNDNTKFCTCTACQNEINTYGRSGYVLRFVNEVAGKVLEAGYTEAIIEMAAYSNYTDAPKGGIVPASNVQIRFADSGRDILHGLTHSNNTQTITRLDAWASITTNNVYNWQYVVNYNNNGVFPSMFYYDDEFAIMMERGVNGWFAEQESCVNADFWDMKLWLIAKLMEKPVAGAEYEALMDEFIYGYYGQAAGKHIRDYLYYMNAKAEASNVYQNFGTHIIGAEWLTVQDIIAGNDYFERAFAAAGDDATLLRRLRAARSGLDRVIVENFVRWEKEAKSAGLTLSFTQREAGERVYQTITEQIKWRGNYYADEPKLAARYDIYAEKTLNNLPADLQGVAPEHIFEYTTADFTNAGSHTTIVNDGDSLVGKAFCYNTAASSNSDDKKGVNIRIYNKGGELQDTQRLCIGQLKANKLQTNQGYQLYYFDWTVPELSSDADARVYIFEDWSLQCYAMFKDLKNLEGKTVRVYLSLKAEGSVSGTWAKTFSGKYYIDRLFILTTPGQLTHNYVSAPATYGDKCRSVCSGCGDVILKPHTWNAGVVNKPHTATTNGSRTLTCTTCNTTKDVVISAHSDCIFTDYVYNYDPNASTPGTVTGVCAYGCAATNTKTASTAHVQVFRANTFTFAYGTLFEDKVITDNSSAMGSAVQYAAYPRRNENTNQLIMSNNVSFTAGTTKNDVILWDIRGEQLKVNQGYQLYKFSHTDFTFTSDPGSIYIFGDWGLQNASLASALVGMIGKDFDMYLSMKITGNIDGANTSMDSSANWPVYYIDCVYLVDKCSFGNYTSDNNATCVTDGTKSATCSICGEKKYAVEEGTATGIHTWNEGVVTVEPTYDSEGEMLYSCTGCGTTRTEVLPTLEDPMTWEFYADDISLLMAHTNNGDARVADPTSAEGKAVKVDYASRAAINDQTMMNAVIFGDGDPMKFHAWPDGEEIGEISIEELRANMGKGYHTYIFRDVPLVDQDDTDLFICLFDDWSIQLKLKNYMEDMRGKKLDIAISMRIDGNVSVSPTYYIDRIVITTEEYVDEHRHVFGAWTYGDTTNHTTSCACGEIKTEAHSWNEGVVTTQPTVTATGTKTYTCSVCNGQKKETLPRLTVPAASWNLTLDGNIAMNFHLNVTPAQAATATVKVTVAGVTTSIKTSTLPRDTDARPVLTVDLAAAQMTEEVTVALTVGGKTVTKTYTVRAYADEILGSEKYDEPTKDLVRYMLVYGTASQQAFAYNTGNFAGAGITVDPVEVPAEGGQIVMEGAIPGMYFYGATLVHENKIGIRFYFAGNIEGVDFGGYEVKTKNEGMYYIEVADICPQDLDQKATVTATSGDKSLTVSYAALDYIIRMYNKEGAADTTKALVKALYGYYVAAEAYTAQ